MHSWVNLDTPPWINEEESDNTSMEDKVKSISAELHTLKDNSKLISNLQSRMARRSQVQFIRSLRQDVKNNKYVNITRYFFREAKQGPKAHGQHLKDPTDPRDEEGNLVWVNANSNAEKLLGSQ